MTNAPVLSEKHHSRILADKENICRVANIPVDYLSESIYNVCAANEIAWIKRYPYNRRQGRGLLLVGKHQPDPTQKMMVMVAALVRNHIDARLVTVQGLANALKAASDTLDATVLFVPNLYQKQGVKSMAPWTMAAVYDLLVTRKAAGKVTALYVEDLDGMEAEFGTVFRQLLDTYLVSEG